MRVLAVDDVSSDLIDLEQALGQAAPGSEVIGTSDPHKALEYVANHKVDVAFLDIELGIMSGLSLAKELRDMQPSIYIIFVTSYDKYAVEAFAIHAAGYLLKPVKADEIRRELAFIYNIPEETKEKNIRVQTFGGFEVFVDGCRLNFKRAKAKELLACLVDRQGASITTRKACELLWEDGFYDRKRKNYFHTVLSDLRATLREAGIEDIMVKTHNRIAVSADRLECDSYRFLEGDPKAVHSYRRNYLPSYSWAEFSAGVFEQKISEILEKKQHI